MNQNTTNTQIPLKGLAIGNGLCDPIIQMAYGDFLFQVGLVDEKGRDSLKNMTYKTKQLINTKQWMKAFDVGDIILHLKGLQI